MTKAIRAMEEDLKLVDLIIELVDARIPVSGRNPEIDRLAAGKSRLLLLTKTDLADQEKTAAFSRYFEQNGIAARPVDARNKKECVQVPSMVAEVCRERIERNRRRGIVGRPMRAMVTGIPNVGKSTFINSVIGKAAAKTGNKPGVTRGKQWLKLDRNLELLDTPGITWPKFQDEETAIRLMLVGSMNEDVLDRQECVSYLLRFLEENYPGMLSAKYGASSVEEIAVRKNLMLPGAMPDTDRTERLILDDFKNGRIGRVTLDEVPVREIRPEDQAPSV